MTGPTAATAATIFDVSGARTVVTGGVSGLGLAMAEAMLDGGATVAITDVSAQRLELDGAWVTIRTAAAVMRRAGAGRIVVTCSTAGLRNEPWVPSAYVAAKTALTVLVKQAALDLAPHGVLVNAIAPGPFRTNIGWDGELPRPPRDESGFVRRVPLGRVGDPSEIKGLALLLASSASSFITGSVITIDGGAMVHQVV